MTYLIFLSASVIIGLSSQLSFFQGERCNATLGVDPISHREVTPDAKKCLEILGFSAFPIPSDTTL